ncbi:response regulator transcription factor [uncultured Eudoraea sp.]|jgi:DNA-binding NarL/FixJ family response regulator|uniref:response regulator transcription factor n=1 Tax=uncultured Eudoraea sp. TaxID=1035614 RepID=UPI0026084C34|nr:response regulator transcription factor [uncultured Eudoraea sp.]
MKSNILKIIVIDNDRLFHAAYRYYFETYQDYSLQGIYVSVEEALKDYDDLLPDIIVSEVSMPNVCGIQGIGMFRKKDPDVKIIMISAQNGFEIIKRAFKNRANGYLTKPVTRKRLYNALNSIKFEGATMSNDIVKAVISMFHRKSYNNFSERENQIIDYLCQGATYKLIADKLFVTTSTVNFHIQNIYLKLDVNSKSEALSKLQEMEN